ncbi:hypothetical protein CNMCM8057_007414 [Aspergillus fumigatus]|nr:hypothetical protein CNMCM8057_007414 [Aspergillus fumigatus]KAF4282071.1 hypothetical protein CNMCM8686_006572 [Aspergillus fumigatus]
MQSVLQPVIGPRKEIHDLTGRVALVTGGALGIGYEISRAFVLNGARVIMRRLALTPKSNGSPATWAI